MKASSNQLPLLLGTILFCLGALFLFGIAFLMGFTALVSLFTKGKVEAQQTIFLVGFGFEAVLLAVAAFFSLQKYLQKPAADQSIFIPASNWLIAVFVSIAGGSIAIGYVISISKALDWLVLPMLTIPAVVLPLAMFLAFAARKLPFGTRWQTWNVLGMAMTLTPLVLFILEILAAVIIFFGVAIYVASQPEIVSRLQDLVQQVTILGPQSKAVFDLLSPFLIRPEVIVTALLYMALIVPAIEEIFKPLGVWLLAGKLEGQAQGFALGALSGAGYALIETIGVSGQATDWAILLLTRIGTGLLHVTTSALMGAAIVPAWRERRYAHLAGTYFLAVLLHGSWNALAMLFSFSTIAEELKQAGRLSTIQPAVMIAMIILAIGLFAILVASNDRMRKTVLSLPMQTAPPDQNTDIDKTT